MYVVAYMFYIYIYIYIYIHITLSMVVLHSRDRHKKHGIPLLHVSITWLTIKTHGSESRGQEEAAVRHG